MGEVFGPISSAELLQQFEARLDLDTYVRHDGAEDWHRLEDYLVELRSNPQIATEPVRVQRQSENLPRNPPRVLMTEKEIWGICKVILKIGFGILLMVAYFSSDGNKSPSKPAYRELNERQEAERQIAEWLLERNGEANAKKLSYTVQEIAERDRQIRNGTYKRP